MTAGEDAIEKETGIWINGDAVSNGNFDFGI